MTRIYEHREFRGFIDRDSGADYSNLEFRRCEFGCCGISITGDPTKRCRVRSIRFVECICDESCGIWAPACEEVLVDTLRTRGLLQAFGAVFRHVTLRGHIGRVMLEAIDPVLKLKAQSEEIQRRWDEANAAFYASVDWALDISQAEFQECDIRSVPARLIRRDPETQVLVTREKALQGDWRELPLDRTYWPTYIDGMLKFGWPDVVLVAPKRSRDFKILLAGLEVLRKAGVAEPD